MNNTAMKIGAAVVGGYLLGRRRKLKLAIGFGTWLVGQKLNLDPKKLVVDLGRELAASPKFGELRDQVRTEVLGAGKSAAGTLLTQSATRLADSLHSRTEGLRGQIDGTVPGAEAGDLDGAEETAEDMTYGGVSRTSSEVDSDRSRSERRPSKSADSQRSRGGQRSGPDGSGGRTARSRSGAQHAKAGSTSTTGDRPASSARAKRSSRSN